MSLGGDDEFTGNGEDTDNNSEDFVYHTLAQGTNPQNSNSNPEPALIEPSPSPTPEPTLTPPNTPTPTLIPTTTPIETPTIAPTSTPVPQPTQTPSPENTRSKILGHFFKHSEKPLICRSYQKQIQILFTSFWLPARIECS